MDVECDHCRALHWKDELALKATGNRFESCCKKGALVLNPFKQPPALLHRLLTDQNARGQAFRKNLRRYNAAFAFTSTECETTDRGLPEGANCFQIHGALYHSTGPLDPIPGKRPRYAQIYFHDPQEATAIRYDSNNGLDQQVLGQITAMLHGIRNPYIGLYKTARERLQQTFSTDPVRILLNPRMQLIMETGADRRRENLPTVNEVAAIVPDNLDDTREREVIITERNQNGQINNSFHHIPCTHPAYMPLAYPLLFPHGDLGFHWGLRLQNVFPNEAHNRGKKVSLRFKMLF